MAKYLKNVKSFEDLKKQFRTLLKENHPDNGGNVEVMQEINAEYDALFKIWKDRHEAQTGETVQETAESTRRQFYTAYGWAGDNYTPGLSAKDLAVIVRKYLKEKYPTCKFSVTSGWATYTPTLDVTIMETPIDIFNREAWKKGLELYHKYESEGFGYYNMPKDAICTDLEKMERENEINIDINQFHFIDNPSSKIFYSEFGYELIKDILLFVRSYKYDDSDSMIDYFDTNFFDSYGIGKWNKGYKVVPKTARIKKQKNEAAKTTKAETEPKEEAPAIEEKASYTFKVTHGEDTRDGSELWVVRIQETLSKDEYIRINNLIKNLGGYYSKFKHGFIFRFEPSEVLKGVA